MQNKVLLQQRQHHSSKYFIKAAYRTAKKKSLRFVPEVQTIHIFS